MSRSPANDNPYAAPRESLQQANSIGRFGIASAWRWYIWTHVALASLPYFALGTEGLWSGPVIPGTSVDFWDLVGLLTMLSIPVLLCVALALAVRRPIQNLLLASAVFIADASLFLVQIGGMLPAVM